MHQIDLDAYFERVGYHGPRQPSAEVLFELHRLQPATIAFEAIDVLTGRGVNLDPQAVDAKLIAGRRGGYCFEQNSVFKRALEALGFRVSALLARSRWNRPAQDIGPRTHMALIVHLAGADWLADVGFGGCMMTAPIRLEPLEVQAGSFEPVRLAPVSGGLQLQTQRAGDWKPVYDLELIAQHDADFLAPNWWTSTHPSSVFRNHLIATTTGRAVRHTLLENRLTILSRDGVSTQAHLDADGLRSALTTLLGLPWAPEWETVVENAVAAGNRLFEPSQATA
jgi:N-hydroxyarylamine O-acetyltransferase